MRTSPSARSPASFLREDTAHDLHARTALSPAPVGRLVDQFELGLDAPICLTWELTYACNLSCVHCLSSSGRRDPRELSTEQCKSIIDELQRMQVFYVNIGGGEPTVRSDFWELVDYATAHQVGVKFSTNGVKIDKKVAARLAASDYVDVQISIDGATAEVNDAVRGPGSFAMAVRALENLTEAGFKDAKISVVVTRHNVGPSSTSSRPSPTSTARPCASPGCARRAAAPTCGTNCTPRQAQQRELYNWLVANGEGVLTGDSFFHLSAYGDALPGLNLCGAGRVVCLIDPVGDVYACPFAIHEQFLAGNIVADGGFQQVWQHVGAVPGAAFPADRRRVQQVQPLRLLPRRLHGRQVLHRAADGRPGPRMRASATANWRWLRRGEIPKSSVDHSRTGQRRTPRAPVPLTLMVRPPAKICDENPLAGMD